MTVDYNSPIWTGLRVDQSLISDAGYGLFAQRSFEPDEVICEYRGRVLSLAQVLRLKDTTYVMGLSMNVHLDANDAFQVPGRYVNDNFDETKLNAKFIKYPKLWKAKVVATRTIQPGDEIYAPYGESYWRIRGKYAVPQ
mmetsp:Transcript_20501/g.26570  ORF Transcript_20501/g.26570 Transcript_20501/m.26570 type:complete len:139 (-) Transcript_20501:1756-2172(-)